MQTRSQRIVRYLPELRGYAHALAGSAQSGDAQLRVMLEALLQDPHELNARRDLRRELFRLFHTVVHSLQLPLKSVVRDEGGVTERRLRDAVASLDLRGREVLLLSSLAKFDRAHMAEILGISATGVERELAAARDQVRRRLSARILIVEDKARTAQRLEQVVEEMGHDVVGVVPSEQAAVDMARQRHPELVVADMHGRDSAAAEAHIGAVANAQVVSLRQPQPRRAGARRSAARGRSARRVTARQVGDAITEALSTPAVLTASALARG
jgi:CheY-like chemotaxis protein